MAMTEICEDGVRVRANGHQAFIPNGADFINYPVQGVSYIWDSQLGKHKIEDRRHLLKPETSSSFISRLKARFF